MLQFMQDQAAIDECLEIVGHEQITGFQLRDTFDEHKEFDVIKKRLTKFVNENKMMKEGKKEESGKDEDKKKKQMPVVNIENMLKSIELAQCIPKMKEQQIENPDVFFSIEEDKLCGLLDIKTEGKKFRFKNLMKQVKEKHEKDLAKKEHGEISEIVE